MVNTIFLRYLLCLIALPALAQFSGLTTTPDGSKLYFVSTLRQNNTTQPLHGKLFSLDDREMKPVLILDPVKVDDLWSNFYNIAQPYLDAGGELAGTRATRSCYSTFFQLCRAFEGSTWRGVQYLGSLTFSPNRRYALNASWRGLSDYGFSLLDLTTNQSIAVATQVNGLHIVTSEGIVWRNASFGIERLTPGATTFESVIPLQRGRFLFGLAHIPGTSNVLAWDNTADAAQLIEFNTTNQSERKIGPPIPLSCNAIKSAARNTLIASCRFRDFTQLLRLDSPQSEWRPIASGFKEWVLSDDGNVIWYLTNNNAFHKVNLLNETDETRLPPLGDLALRTTDTSPGSLFYIKGSGIGNASLLLSRGTQSTELMALERRDDQLVFLMPQSFPFPITEYVFELIPRQPSLFEYRQLLPSRIRPVAPLFFRFTTGLTAPEPVLIATNPVAASADFSTLISRNNPARPNQVIHLWAVNLGPFSSGTLTTPNFACFGATQKNPELLYAGPAPGIEGLYQVSLRLPDTFQNYSPNDPFYYFSCGFTPAFSFDSFIQLPAAP